MPTSEPIRSDDRSGLLSIGLTATFEQGTRLHSGARPAFHHSSCMIRNLYAILTSAISVQRVYRAVMGLAVVLACQVSAFGQTVTDACSFAGTAFPVNSTCVTATFNKLNTYVHDITPMMNQIKSLLMPDGVLFIAVPNHTSRDASQYGAQWAAYDVPRHLWHFSPQSISKLLAKHGFRLSQKITMPLDAFYVSMLSEKYRGNNFFGPAGALFSGLRTLVSGNKNVDRASSIIYVARLQQ